MAQVNSNLIVFVVVLIIVVFIGLFLVVFYKNTTTDNGGGGSGTCLNPILPPTNLTLASPLADIVAASWTAVAGATGYRMYISNIQGFIPSGAISVQSTSTNAAQIGDLSLGVRYYVTVTSFNNECGESIPSNEVSIFIPYIFPTRFKIVNRGLPLFDATCHIVNTFGYTNPEHMVVGSSPCNPLECWMNFDTLGNNIKLANNNAYCLARNFSSLEMRLCTSSADIDKSWTYNDFDHTLCLSSEPESCLAVDDAGDGINAEDRLRLTPNTLDLRSRWNIVPT